MEVMKDFEELISDYDQAKEIAKEKIKNVITDLPVFKIAVLVPIPVSEIIKYPNKPVNDNVIIFEFVKDKFNKWVLNK